MSRTWVACRNVKTRDGCATVSAHSDSTYSEGDHHPDGAPGAHRRPAAPLMEKPPQSSMALHELRSKEERGPTVLPASDGFRAFKSLAQRTSCLCDEKRDACANHAIQKT